MINIFEFGINTVEICIKFISTLQISCHKIFLNKKPLYYLENMLFILTIASNLPEILELYPNLCTKYRDASLLLQYQFSAAKSVSYKPARRQSIAQMPTFYAKLSYCFSPVEFGLQVSFSELIPDY